jgi:hypothetical protein
MLLLCSQRLPATLTPLQTSASAAAAVLQALPAAAHQSPAGSMKRTLRMSVLLPYT